eukprot:COSAG01_NODE_1201_length_11274_cov_639.212349_6_plen_222_part_00
MGGTVLLRWVHGSNKSKAPEILFAYERHHRCCICRCAVGWLCTSTFSRPPPPPARTLTCPLAKLILCGDTGTRCGSRPPHARGDRSLDRLSATSWMPWSWQPSSARGRSSRSVRVRRVVCSFPMRVHQGKGGGEVGHRLRGTHNLIGSVGCILRVSLVPVHICPTYGLATYFSQTPPHHPPHVRKYAQLSTRFFARGKLANVLWSSLLCLLWGMVTPCVPH